MSLYVPEGLKTEMEMRLGEESVAEFLKTHKKGVMSSGRTKHVRKISKVFFSEAVYLLLGEDDKVHHPLFVGYKIFEPEWWGTSKYFVPCEPDGARQIQEQGTTIAMLHSHPMRHCFVRARGLHFLL